MRDLQKIHMYLLFNNSPRKCPHSQNGLVTMTALTLPVKMRGSNKRIGKLKSRTFLSDDEADELKVKEFSFDTASVFAGRPRRLVKLSDKDWTGDGAHACGQMRRCWSGGQPGGGRGWGVRGHGGSEGLRSWGVEGLRCPTRVDVGHLVNFFPLTIPLIHPPSRTPSQLLPVYPPPSLSSHSQLYVGRHSIFFFQGEAVQLPRFASPRSICRVAAKKEEGHTFEF